MLYGATNEGFFAYAVHKGWALREQADEFFDAVSNGKTQAQAIAALIWPESAPRPADPEPGRVLVCGTEHGWIEWVNHGTMGYGGEVVVRGSIDGFEPRDEGVFRDVRVYSIHDPGTRG